MRLRRPTWLLAIAALSLSGTAMAQSDAMFPLNWRTDRPVANYNPDRPVAVADKTGIVGGFPATQISSGTTSTTYRHHLHVNANMGFFNPQLIYSNSYLVNGSEDQAGPNSMTVKAVLAYNGNNYPFSILGATSGTTVAPGATVVSEPVGVTIPNGADVYICTYVTVASGGWPVGRALASATGGEGSSGTNGADDTGSCAPAPA